MTSSTRLRSTATLWLLLMPLVPASAQTIRGTVVDDESGAPVGTAAVAVLAEDESSVARVMTDERGRFVFRMPDAGSYRLGAGRIGYRPATSDVFPLAEGQSVLVELRLQISPVLLDMLETVVDGRSLGLARVGFYHRERMGAAQVKTPQDLEAKRPVDMIDLFRDFSGIRVIHSGTNFALESTRMRGCRPSVAIDGLVVARGGRRRSTLGSTLAFGPASRLGRAVGRQASYGSYWSNLIHVSQVAAVEVIAGAAALPPSLGGYGHPCGGIVIWTKGYVMSSESFPKDR